MRRCARKILYCHFERRARRNFFFSFLFFSSSCPTLHPKNGSTPLSVPTFCDRWRFRAHVTSLFFSTFCMLVLRTFHQNHYIVMASFITGSNSYKRGYRRIRSGKPVLIPLVGTNYFVMLWFVTISCQVCIACTIYFHGVSVPLNK